MAATIAFSGVGVATAAPLAPTQSVSVIAGKKAPAITFNKISNKTVKGSAKATIKPSVKAAKGVKVTKKLLTVKQGKKTVAKNKASVALKAGTYKVTTTVNYTVGKKKLKVAKTQTLVIKKAWATAAPQKVTPGAFCAKADKGKKGIGKKNGKIYTCKTGSDPRLRWR